MMSAAHADKSILILCEYWNYSNAKKTLPSSYV